MIAVFLYNVCGCDVYGMSDCAPNYTVIYYSIVISYESSSTDKSTARYRLVNSREDVSSGFELRNGLLAPSVQVDTLFEVEGNDEIILSNRPRVSSGSGDGITLVDMRR